MVKIQIKHKFSDEVLFEGDYESLKHAVDAAVRQGANLRDANFQGADFRGADFRGADFRGADFRGADFWGADFQGADFQNANFQGADFQNANFQNANFQNANFQNADFWGADFRGADFRGANFQGADFQGADLWGKKQKIAPLQIIGLHYYVMTDGNTVKIGCEEHLWDDWLGFDDDEISQMDSGALNWWREHKPLVQALVEQHRRLEAKHD